MTGIRALERTDLPAVCDLYEAVARSGAGPAPAQLVRYFERTFLGHPWADPALPSLVHEDRDGRIVGFLGSHVRRLRLDGRPLVMACSGQLVADPAPAHRGVGALLLRRYLAGPQDLTITDGATDTVRRMWVGFGGEPLAHASIGWSRVLRPGAAIEAVSVARPERTGVRRIARLLAPAIDALAGLPPANRGFGVGGVATVGEELTPEEFVAQVRGAASALRLHPDYDVDFVEWLFHELDAVTVRGRAVRRLVRSPDGRVVGWYVYFLAHRGVAQVMQIGALDGDPGPVLDDLFAHAAKGGAAVVSGRVEPGLLAALPGRRCIFSRTEWALVHAREPSVLAALGSTKALLTRLDGEWWMGHHLLWRHVSRPAQTASTAGSVR
jgi:hypothetical protein